MTMQAFKESIAKPKYLLVVVLVIGAFLRFWGLSTAEIFHDEGFYAFRSIGYLDYVQNDDQTTPLQWFKSAALPWWTRLSFHDHPPLFFIIQHIFLYVFGDSIFVARLPSALSGVALLYVIFLIAREIFKNEYAGVAAASVVAVNQIHIWVSRSSIMESVLLLFIGLAFYAFLKFLEQPRHWALWGTAMGLAFLTKYTSFFIVPTFVLYALIMRRDLFRTRQFYAGFIIAAAIFSPVIVYNFYLYNAVHHFDLQFAYLFKQITPEWKASIGKIQEPFKNIGLNLAAMYSIPFLAVFLGGLIYSFFLYKVKKFKLLPLAWLTLIFITLMLIAVGSAFRFISLYVVPAVFFILLLPVFYFENVYKTTLGKAALSAFFVYELAFTVSGIFVTFPDYGVVKLDNYFDGIFGETRSLAYSKSPIPHIDKVIQEFNRQRKPADKSYTIIYDENIDLATRLWLFTRRLIYRGIPAVTAKHFKSLLKERGVGYFKGYEFYFVKPSEYTILNPYFQNTDGLELENFLKTELKLSPEKIIYGHEELPMFYLYKFTF